MQSIKHKVTLKNRKIKFRPDAERHMTYYSNRMKAYMENHKILNLNSNEDLPSFNLNSERSIGHIVLPEAKVINITDE